MDSYVITILPGGRITIPAAIRKELDLHPGDTLEYKSDGRDVVLRKAEVDGPALSAADTDEPKSTGLPGRDAE